MGTTDAGIIGLDAMPSEDEIKEEIESASDWFEAYCVGKKLSEHYPGEADLWALMAFEKSFETGLNIRRSRERYLKAVRQSAKIYYRFKEYDKAINMLMVLDSNEENLPSWVSVYLAAALINTRDGIEHLSEKPALFFKRLDRIASDEPEHLNRRKYLFLEFINRITDSIRSGGNLNPDVNAILLKASEFGLMETPECKSFIVEFGMVPYSVNSDEVFDGSLVPNLDNAVFDELNNESNDELNEKLAAAEAKIEELEDSIAGYLEEIRELRDQLSAKETQKHISEDSFDSGLDENDEEERAEAERSRIIDEALIFDNYLTRNQKILIIGGTEVKEVNLRGSLKGMGFSFTKDQLEFQTDYENIKNTADRINPHSGKYAGIIVGPCPHKCKDVGNYSSLIERLKSEEYYPHVEEARDKAGQLKITGTSLKEAMYRMASHLISVT